MRVGSPASRFAHAGYGACYIDGHTPVVDGGLIL
jgi:hypothetical protein